MGPKCRSNPAPVPRQPLPARTVNGSERKLKISCKSMGEELPRNVSLCNRHCRGGAWRRSGLRGRGEGRNQDGGAAPSALTSGPSLHPLVVTSLCFQNPSISSPPWPPPGPAVTVSSLGSLLLPVLLRACPPLCSEPPRPPEFPPRPENNPTSLLTRSHRPPVTSSLSPTRRPHSAAATLNPLLLPTRLARSNPRAFASAVAPARNTLPSHLLRVPRCPLLHYPGLRLNVTSSEASLSTLARVDRPPPGPRYSSPCFISCTSASKIILHMFP